MLNIDNPQSKHIFRAAVLEDRIRPFLVAAEKEGRNLFDNEKNEALATLDELDKLNEEHFNANHGIKETIEELRATIHGNSDVKDQWQKFLNLAETEGKNFGTWMI